MRIRPTGIAVYGRGLIQALSDRSPARYELIHPLSRWGRRRSLRDAGAGLPIRAYTTGRSLASRYSLVHALDTRLPGGYSGPLVVTVFDVLSAMPESEELGFSSPRFRAKKLEAYDRLARSADAIITLSHSTRDALVESFRPRGPVYVIPPGVAVPEPLSVEERATLLAPLGIQAPFVLTVGALCPRKNVEACVRAALVARKTVPVLKLVLVGEPLPGWEGSAGARAVESARDLVVLAGYLPPRALQAAYQSAEAVVHLAHHEGYGLTVLEALVSGTPVLASDRGGIPEAAGGAAWLVNPDEPGAAGLHLLEILKKSPEVRARGLKGIAHARSLRWETTAERVEQVYHEVLGV